MVEDRRTGGVKTPGEVVAALKREVVGGRNQQGSITSLLRQVLDGGYWAEFDSPVTGITKTYSSFHKFVESELGVRNLDVLVGWVGPKDPDLADRVRKVWREEIPASAKVGRPAGNDEKNSNYSLNNASSDGLLARLKRDHPALAQQVIAGELTATAAARKAGIITPTVRLGKPATVAAKLREHYNAEDLAELARLIGE